MLLSEVYQLAEKTWTPDVNPVVATLTVVGQYSTDQYGFKQPIQLKDESGVSSEITLQSKYEKGLMAQNMIGRKARWRLKWYQGGQKQVIVGYCLDKMNGSQPVPATTPQAQPQGQQAPQQAAGQPQGNDRAEGMVRHGVVCAYISAGVDPDIPTCNYWTQYIMTGQAPPPPGQGVQPGEAGW